MWCIGCSLLFKIISPKKSSLINCTKQTMKALLESSPIPQELPLPSPRRKNSMMQQPCCEWEQAADREDLHRLKCYISSNIQSERKNILQLYSSSFLALQKNDHLLFPDLTLTERKNLKSSRSRSLWRTLSPVKTGFEKEANNDKDFIVTHNFPNRLVKKCEKLKIDILLPPTPTIKRKKKEITNMPPLSPQTKQQKIIRSAIRTKVEKRLPKLVKVERIAPDPCDLNPWQYLKIQDEPIFSIF